MRRQTLADVSTWRGFNFFEGRNALPLAADFDALAAAGATCVRIWLSATWDGGAYVIPIAHLRNLDAGIRMLASRGLYAVIAVNIDPDMQPWGDKARSGEFVRLWYTLARRYWRRKAVAAFDLLNEPRADSIEEWSELATRCIQAIRLRDGARLAMFEFTPQAHPDYIERTAPLAADGVIYSAHVYQPFDLTHQGVSADFPSSTEYDAARWDELQHSIGCLKRWKAQHQKPLYIGEFGCANWAPNGAAVRYVDDCTRAFRQLGAGWAWMGFRSAPVWDPEAVPDGRGEYVRSGDAPLMLALSAAMA
jgi:endoglucanase